MKKFNFALVEAVFTLFMLFLIIMPFEIKILEEIHCPRCNGKAHLKIDEKRSGSKWIIVYIVCQICKLNRYSHTTTRKAVLIHARINRMKKKGNSSKVSRKVKQLEALKEKAERQFE